MYVCIMYIYPFRASTSPGRAAHSRKVAGREEGVYINCLECELPDCMFDTIEDCIAAGGKFTYNIELVPGHTVDMYDYNIRKVHKKISEYSHSVCRGLNSDLYTAVYKLVYDYYKDRFKKIKLKYESGVLR